MAVVAVSEGGEARAAGSATRKAKSRPMTPAGQGAERGVGGEVGIAADGVMPTATASPTLTADQTGCESPGGKTGGMTTTKR